MVIANGISVIFIVFSVSVHYWGVSYHSIQVSKPSIPIQPMGFTSVEFLISSLNQFHTCKNSFHSALYSSYTQDIFKQATEDRLTSAKELPYFEGDFWPNVLEESIKELEQEEEERKREENNTSNESTDVSEAVFAVLPGSLLSENADSFIYNDFQHL